ncbi:MAG: ferredoxin family protein [Bdellovibrionota bacterium]
MTYVVTKPCLGTKDRSCIEVCPVDCFYDIRKKEINDQFGVEIPDDGDDDDKVGMLMIHPDECINCGACETECPVEAIFEDSGVPDSDKVFVEMAEKELLEMTQEQLDSTRCVP